MSQLGFAHEIYPQLEVGNIIYFTNSFNQAVDYFILLPIDNKTKLANHENFSENEQYLEGTGIWENKGCVAIVLSALQTLRFTRSLKKIKIGVLLITDSSIDNRYSKSIIHQKTEQAKKVISVSGSSKSGGLILSRSGSAVYRLETKLVQRNAAENVSLIAMNFNKTLAAITDISKNDSENVIAPFDIQFKSNIFKVQAYGSAGISVRYNSKETLELIEQKIKKIITQQKRSKIYYVLFEGGQKRPPMEQTEQITNFYNSIQTIAKQIDVRISKEHRWSSSDICHISKDLPKIDGLGPIGEILPSNNERVFRHSLLERSLLMALILNS